MDRENQYRTGDYGLQVWGSVCGGGGVGGGAVSPDGGSCEPAPHKTHLSIYQSSSSVTHACLCPHFPNQDARKGILFCNLPPVLQPQLKGFEYDFQRDSMIKVRN